MFLSGFMSLPFSRAAQKIGGKKKAGSQPAQSKNLRWGFSSLSVLSVLPFWPGWAGRGFAQRSMARVGANGSGIVA